MRRTPRRPSPSQYLVGGFLILILLGAALLTLPSASAGGNSAGFLNALFTSVSAACVTGQVVVTTAEQWSIFGRVVILLLIQIGGIGVITLVTVAMRLLGLRLSLPERVTIGAAFGQDGARGMERLIVSVVKVTLICEAAGAVLLTIGFYTADGSSFGAAVSRGVFHAASAFCNAGFDIVGSSSMTPYVANPLINLTLMALIVGGGVGFPVWVSVAGQIKKTVRDKLPAKGLWRRLDVHAKVVLSVTLSLIVIGAALFFFLEYDNPDTLGALTLPGKLWASFFQSVTLRTAGFNTISQGSLQGSSQFLSCALMVIGGSPAGTAGGIKTVTFAVIVFSMVSALRGQEQITAWKRRVTLRSLQKAITMTAMLVSVVVAGAVILRFTEHGNPYPHTFLDLLFECSSVSATVGVTTGITPHLSAAGKIVLIVSMFIGRLGPTTVAMALSAPRGSAGRAEMTYPDADIIIG